MRSASSHQRNVQVSSLGSELSGFVLGFYDKSRYRSENRLGLGGYGLDFITDRLVKQLEL